MPASTSTVPTDTTPADPALGTVPVGTPVDDTGPRRPALAADACLHPPVDADDVWVAQVGPQRYLRVGADAATLLGILDGARDARQLAEALGPPWSPEVVGRSLKAFVKTGLVVDAADAASTGGAGGSAGSGGAGGRRRWRPRLPRRVAYRPPLSIQLTLVDPSRLLGRFRPALRRLTRPVACGGYLAVAVAGLGALAWQAGSLRQVISHPLGLREYGIVLAGLLVVTGIHELGHAAVLTAFGGRPRRLGVMLFYLTPAFFCDISDGWRLRHNRDRVATALAGVAVQWVCAGVAALASLALPAGDPHDAVVGLALACYVYGILNLVPFVKFDGYIALMSHLDIPHLRRKSMADARRATAKALFGGRYRRELPRLGWAVPFGVLCLLFPVYLVGFAAQSWLGGLLAMGPAGAVGCVALIGVMIALVARACWHLLVEARAAGAGTLRIALVSTLVVGLVGAAVALVDVPRQVQAGYVVEDGRVLLVLPEGTDPGAATAGHRVELRQTGLLGGSTVGTATTTGETARTDSPYAPMGTVLPIRGGPRTITATFHPLTATNLPDGVGRLGGTGQAEIKLGRVSAGAWLVDTYLTPAIRSIIG
ncbi:daptide biosynthesis intramembrane metalloprotease [Parafrankia discariae]|uniref:daptide biosynthesis intramembrane metalloprotease n=1 Tax=Parafrankia discariae TaxID=365528 RepID=UPI00037B1621|nr:daptide biosynthesis intramembrane metalloprotease [Parafrankia discariae]